MIKIKERAERPIKKGAPYKCNISLGRKSGSKKTDVCLINKRGVHLSAGENHRR